ncbi:MAG: hypothetical protein ACQEQX_07140 [Thermodesulfobacteriota bacterium]
MHAVSQAEEKIRQAWELMIPVERGNLKHPELIASCRQAFIHYAQALYQLLDLDFPQVISQSQEEDPKALGQEARRLARVSLPQLFPYKKDLPKVIMLAFFWSSYERLAATACKEAELAQSAFFGKNEAGYAASEAKHCHKIIKSLIDLSKA